MRKPKSFLRMFTDTGPLAVLAVAIALLVGIVAPASAQFFNFGGFGGPPQRQARAAWRRLVRRRFLCALPATGTQARARISPGRRRPTSATLVPERNVLVLGDAMADWLAYGLEDAYTERPDMGVIRKHGPSPA